jgi:uncharacterized protein (TIGR02996 family)
MGYGPYRPTECVLCWRRAGRWSLFALPGGTGLAMDVAPDGTAFLSLGGTPAEVGQRDPILFRFRAGQLEQVQVPDTAEVRGLHHLASGELLAFLADGPEVCSAWLNDAGEWSEVGAPFPIRGNHSGRVVCQTLEGQTYVATQDGTLRLDDRERGLALQSKLKGLRLWRAADALYCLGAVGGSWAHEVLTPDGWQPLVIDRPEWHSRDHVKVGRGTLKTRKVRLRRPEPAKEPPDLPLSDRWARNAELEQAIIDDPDRPEPYLVYGDWLQARGDPRGALIALMHAALDRPEMQSPAAEAARAFEQALLDDFLRHMKLGWRLGFVDDLRLVQRKDADYPEILARALDHPVMVFLRSFAFNFALPKKTRQEACAALLARLSRKADTLGSVDLSGSACFDRVKNLGVLAPLRRLTRLDLESTKATRLDGLEPLTGLEVLNLDYNPLKSIDALASLMRLRKLSLRNLPVADLAPLSGLSRLEDLRLRGASCADLTPLSGLTSLKRLDIGSTKVADLRPLAGLQQLEYLDARFVSADLSPIEGLPGLAEVLRT